MPEYFFELLTEEIPAWMHDGVAETLRTKLGAEFGKEVRVNTTPRRIAFLICDLPAKEEDREIEVKGPPKKSGDQALQGFLKKQNATVDDVLESADEYVRIRKRIAGRQTGDILSERIPAIIEGLRWPKMMRWGAGEHAYIRPIHSVVSIFDGQHQPLAIFAIASGTKTVGHRTLAPHAFEVTSYNDYVSKLELARVVIDPLRRREVMAGRARVLANDVHGVPSTDATIWSQWQYLTEYPGVVRAEFRPEYLALPEEVLVTVMRVHQKQLPIRSADGKLTSFFLAVLDNEGDPDGNAAYGNSFVTNARFADAKFFYETDRRKELEQRLDQLAHLQFQEKLGNYLEKTKRIERIAEAIGGDADALTAARLAKTDLVTEMVKEFTDLQGKVGGIYAREEGQPEAVWQAIYDHYLPLNLEDELPRTRGGALVSLADKMDTLAGFFSVGIRPTGSKDPFALRRAAQGVVQILLNRDKREVKITTDALFEAALRVHDGPLSVQRELVDFFGERIQTILETAGFAYDEIQAATSAGWQGLLTDLVDRITAVREVRNDPNFLSLLDSAKRIANITEGHTDTSVDPGKLEHDTEKRLHQLADVVGSQVKDLIGEKRYRAALESFAALAPELEAFFRDVMVMVEDEAVRRNRMSLLRKVGNAVGRIADVTKIVVARRDYRA